METGTPKLHIVETQLNAHGHRTWLDTSKVPLRNARGEVIGVLGIFADITELKDAEATLQRTRRHLEDAIEAIDAGLVMYDADERLVFCNENYRRIYKDAADLLQPGCSYEAVLRTYLARRPDLVVGTTVDEWVRLRLEAHRRCERYEQQLGDRVILIQANRTRDGGVVSLRTEITADKVRERELRRAKEDAVAASQAKTAFLANLSHEIRTPMSAILGFTDVLLNSAPRADQLDLLQVIQRNGEHLLKLINDILDLSKIEAGKLQVSHEPTDLVQLLRDVQALMAVRAEGKGLELTLELAPRLPRTIDTDAMRLRQILVNLLGNAVKFTETGSVRMTVATRPLADGGDLLEIGVCDTGVGIPPEHLERVFEAFEQADASTTRRFGGTGLGLAISRRLAHLLGGEITVQSRPAIGSRFTLTHPVPAAASWVETDGPPRSEGPDPARRPEPNVSLAGRTVLLVEDGPDNRRLLSHYLSAAGAAVVCANDGIDALAQVAQAAQAGRSFDLVLMDMQMPRLDGYAATQQLRAGGSTLPIVALTAHAMAGDRQRCLDIGCDDYLSKPVRRVALVQAVARWIEHHRGARG
jgi:signal transduction histidine kinase/ActR/RegA family two-component response regulator